MSVDYSGFVGAAAAQARIRADLDRNYVGTKPLGEQQAHRDTKPPKKAALDLYREEETTKD